MRILLVDDHTLFRQGLVKLLGSQPDLVIVGEAGSVAEAVVKARELKPDLVLLDYSLPDGEGPDAARAILADLPRTNVVFLTVHETDSHLLSAIRTGAIGYLIKDTPFEKLVVSIRAVARDEPALSNKSTLSLMHEIAHPHSQEDGRNPNLSDLNKREMEILKALAADASNEEIGHDLNISVSTVKNYVHNIFQKLNLKNRKEVARFARHQGLASNR
jgi:DNA-binding NarL/FixJ family response regulator